jgi:Rhodopirellula transposase DDE domain
LFGSSVRLSGAVLSTADRPEADQCRIFSRRSDRLREVEPSEDRLFSFISGKWAGPPLRTWAVLLAAIRGTTTGAGLTVEAVLHPARYQTGWSVTAHARQTRSCSLTLTKPPRLVSRMRPASWMQLATDRPRTALDAYLDAHDPQVTTNASHRRDGRAERGDTPTS